MGQKDGPGSLERIEILAIFIIKVFLIFLDNYFNFLKLNFFLVIFSCFEESKLGVNI